MNNVLLEVKNIKKSYSVYNKPSDRLKESFLLIGKRNYKNTFTALEDISFDVRQGELLGIIGPNGAGKSTLLKIVTDILQPDEGEVIRSGKIESLLELGSSFNPDFNGYQNIDLYLQLRNTDKSKVKDITQAIIDFSEIEDFMGQPVKTHSSGMFARLAFACAINCEFDILIVDEILSVGDIQFQNKCITRMKTFANEGKSIIFVSHDMHSIKYFCDYVIRLDLGKIIDRGNNVVDIVEKFENNIMPDGFNSNTKVDSTNNDMIKITSTVIKNSKGIETTKIRFQEDFSVEIEYIQNQYEEGMFFGVGFRNSNNQYISGLNTKIDKVELNKSNGNHKLVLHYKNQSLYNDTFTLWSVCYNNSGTVVFSDYIIKNAFTVVSDKQLCEGVVYFEHEWRK